MYTAPTHSQLIKLTWKLFADIQHKAACFNGVTHRLWYRENPLGNEKLIPRNKGPVAVWKAEEEKLDYVPETPSERVRSFIWKYRGLTCRRAGRRS